MAGGMPLTEALGRRRSRREFVERPLSREHISQLCWAAQGITDHEERHRAAPSAGALFPLHLLVVGSDGVCEYDPEQHALRRTASADVRARLRGASFEQGCVGEAPICIVISVELGRTAPTYGDRAERYCLLEAGHVAQNILLVATAMGLAGVPVGAFEDDTVGAVLNLPPGQRAIYLLPVGYARA
jgi:SagB-type dehydrogenase family enzyme